EFRLHLRSDNADQRLTEPAHRRGLVGAERAERFAAKQVALAGARRLLDALRATPTEARKAGLPVNADGQRRSAFELLSYPDLGVSDLTKLWPQLAELPAEVAAQVAIDAQYAV